MPQTVRRGVFPGSFDPLTVAHVAMADAGVEALGLDRLELSVSRGALGKPHLDETLEDRVADLRTVVADRPGWGVVVTTARLLADVADGFDAVVLGADKLAQVLDPTWYRSAHERDEAVRRLPTLGVAPRTGEPLDVLVEHARSLGAEVVVLDVADHLHEVSATAVRAGRHDWRAVG